jgi:quercetin dioxygenase-like cupin family protein
MQGELIEHKWIDLEAAPHDAGAVTHLTNAADPQWTGIVDIGPSGTYALAAGWRHDVYVLRGTVEIGGRVLGADDFLVHCGAAVVSAGEAGARLLVYREATDARCEPLVEGATERIWHDGRNPHMRVVPLANRGHRVSLVAWEPGARTRDHGHANGEELFVRSGELRNGGERYPAGTWLRLHPGARHEPFAAQPAVILLRNGHLRAASD